MTTTEGITQPSVAPARTRRRLVVAGIATLGLFAAAIAIGQLSPQPVRPPSANVGTQLNTALPPAIASLPLIDENGASTNLAAFTGKIVVLSSFLTLCQEVCPFTTAELNDIDKNALSSSMRDKVQFVNISVDPGRDDPAHLHAYRAFAQLLPNWTLLTGTPENLATLWNYFGASYSQQPEPTPASTDWFTGKTLTYDVEHSDVLVYLDATTHQRFVIQGMPNGENAPLTSGERSFLSSDGVANLTNSDNAAWTEPQALQVVSWLTKKHLHLKH
ncbi:MAG TPA: SCO family protein [Acidothermaceae bacterium]|jgi:protein SCO1/2